MATAITTYKIFLASPSDLNNERESIREVVENLNLTYGRQQNLRIELLMWETHSAPGASINHVQSTINNDLGSDYDIFIGLLWSKFGTPTDHAPSGTVEEYNIAYARFQENPLTLQLLFYFKIAPIAINDIDPAQIQKIQEFKKLIGKERNQLYWDFQDMPQLQKFLMLHIPLRIEELRAHDSSSKEVVISSNNAEETVLLAEELGVFDYEDMMTEYIQESNNSLEKITEATEWIAGQMHKKTDELNALIATGSPDRNAVIEIMKRTAKTTNNYAQRLEPEIPIFYENFEKAIECMSSAVNIYKKDFDSNVLDDTRVSLQLLITNMESSIEGNESFLEALNGWPRMQKDLNMARSNAADKLGKLLANLRVCRQIAVELQKRIDE
jgi:PHD/YefM family antitoxin component YafN of YafNO toxin-antitoxin module